jgi:hypothetical protein
MNDIIKKELSKVKVANLDNFNTETLTYNIPKYKQFKPEINKSYLVELNDDMLITNTISINWNNNSVPSNKYYKIEVIKILGKMIYVDGLAFDFLTKTDLNKTWSGWLPLEQLKFIETY